MPEPKDANRSPDNTPAPRSPKEQDQFTEIRNERSERGTNREQDREDSTDEPVNVTNRSVDERGNVTVHSVDEHGNAREQRADTMSDEKKSP
jgi:hypothetical protein